MSSPATDFGPLPMQMPTPYDYMEPATWSHMHDSGYGGTSSTMPSGMPQYTHAMYTHAQYYTQSGEFGEFGEMDHHPSYQYALETPNSTGFSEMEYATPFQGAVQSSSFPQPENSHADTEAYVQTVRSKIIIKGFSSGTKAEQIHDLVLSKAGSDSEQIHSISIQPSKSGGNRGYVIVIFYTEEVAQKAIKKLHGYKFGGKTLNVGFTNELVSLHELSRPKPGKHHREEREKKEAPKASGSKDDKKDKSHTKRGVVIVNGSSKKASENSKKH
jgi:RNA recognition motif-containing protein